MSNLSAPSLRRTALLPLAACLAVLAGCQPQARQAGLTVVAEFPNRQPTGLAISPDGRTFLTFPRWSEQHDLSVAELKSDGTLVPYPDDRWNSWSPSDTAAGEKFVCAQAAWSDGKGKLYVLDAANPMFQGVVAGGPKLVQIDLATNKVSRVYGFAPDVAGPQSYLNDVRVDAGRGVAYITESGTGSLVVLKLDSGKARRVLAKHPSTKAEPIDVVIQGHALVDAGGRAPQVNADGIALSSDGRTLFYHALTRKTLWRCQTEILRRFDANEAALDAAPRKVAETGVCDGMILDPRDDLYQTAIEQNAIISFNVSAQRTRTVVQSPLLSWPDSLAFGPDGSLYVTTSQIHRSGRFQGIGPRTQPYRLIRIPASMLDWPQELIVPNYGQ